MLTLTLAVGLLQTPADDDKKLTPEQILELLRETQTLMNQAEELLHLSSAGRAVEAEKRVVDLLKDDPTAGQQSALAKIEKLMGKSQGEQQGAVERLKKIIAKAPS